jgi:hypothetical protein
MDMKRLFLVLLSVVLVAVAVVGWWRVASLSTELDEARSEASMHGENLSHLTDGFEQTRDDLLRTEESLRKARQRVRSVEAQVPTRNVTGDVPLSVSKSGFALFKGRLSAAALLANRSNRLAGDIRLRLTLYDRHGDVVVRVPAHLPYCPAHSRCWWSASFLGGQVSRDWRSTSELEVEVVRAPARERARDSIVAFPVHRDRDGTVRGRAPRGEGLVFIIGFSDGKPRSGISVNIAEDVRLGRSIGVQDDIFPMIAGESLKAFMYNVEFNPGH